jgi:hypothetical protein
MYTIDIIIFIVIIVSITTLLFYFKRDTISDDIKGLFKTKEDFSSGSEKYNLKDYNVNIGKNLFVGFDDAVKSDNQQELLKNAYMGKFQTNMKDIELSKGNIFINGGPAKKLGRICLGGGAGSICMNNINLNNFDETQFPIPVFKKGDKQVYYNHDQPLVNHNKLCFKDKCIDKKHLNMINGSHALRLKIKKGSDFESIRPYNVEFGQRKGFSNVISHPFHMTPSDYNKANPIIENRGRNLTCYGAGGRTYHTINSASSRGDQYYLRPQPVPNVMYSHIHKHTDK